MLKLLRESEVAPQFRKLRKTSDETMLAVPFWGKGAIKTLGLRSRQNVRVICNLGSGACNPHVIADLKKLKGVEVRTHPRLHAKIYATKNFSIVGSSNASTNGLTVEGEALKGWIEANVLSDDPELVQSTLDLFDEIWRSDETKNVSRAALLEAQTAWDNRPKPPARPTARTLLAACRENPELFASVYIAAYDEPLGPDGKQALAKVRAEAVPTPGLGVSDFRKAWGYQFQEIFTPGSWVVDLDCRNPDKPKVWGCARIPTPSLRLKVKGEHDLTLAVQMPVTLNGTSRQYRLSPEEKNALIEHAGHIFKHANDGLLPLSEVIRIIDKANSGLNPR